MHQFLIDRFLLFISYGNSKFIFLDFFQNPIRALSASNSIILEPKFNKSSNPYLLNIREGYYYSRAYKIKILNISFEAQIYISFDLFSFIFNLFR